MTLQAGVNLHGRYRIVKLLNQGGFGSIYRAWDTTLGRPCALKENLDTSSQAQRQFEREAKILANLSHPNLPRVTDYFFIPGQGQYLVMDYVDGQDLQEMLESKGTPLAEEKLLPWIEQVCNALTYLHEQNPPIIHRDIKPANIIITPDGRAMLVDFGIAKIYDPQLKTTLGARAVTPSYSPHEQYGQDITDARSDIYSLGATVYTLLTGQEPPESIQRIVKDPLVQANRINPNLSSRVAAGLQRALHIDPDLRFQTAAEFLSALLGGELNTPDAVSGRMKQSALPSKLVISPWVWVMLISVLIAVPVLIWMLGGSSNPAVIDEMSITPYIPETRETRTVLATDVPATRVTESVILTAEPTPQVYIVQAGDTCGGLAIKFGTTVGRIISLNDLDAACNIFVGQQLLIAGTLIENGEESTGVLTLLPVVTQVAQIDGMPMVYVPAGDFSMGAVDDDSQASEDEKPLHRVSLSAFWMDRNEVTNAMYALCVQAKVCQEPAMRSSETRLFYYGDARYGDYPAIHVSWTDANTYCTWVGRRLPSEAEWEKAGRGPDGYTFPWGNSNPTSGLLNYNNQVGDTTPVGSYLQGSSPYGVMDMAGNVGEWVADWYDPYYYEFSPIENPSGALSGEFRVLRGGSWFSPLRAVRASFRHWNTPEQGNSSTGFRCAQSP